MKKICCLALAILVLCMFIPQAMGESGFSVSYVTPGGVSEERLTDADVMTRITAKKGGSIELKLSNAGEGRTLYLEWFTLPKDAVLTQYDDGNTQIESIRFASPTRYTEEIPVDPACVRIVLAAKSADLTVSSMYVSTQAPEIGRAHV